MSSGVLHVDSFEVDSPNVKYSEDYIESTYQYESTDVQMRNGKAVAVPKKVEYQFRTQRKTPKLGLMLVGWGGNNGSTCTAGILANKHKMEWETKEGKHKANYFGSLTQASTCRLGAAVPTTRTFTSPSRRCCRWCTRTTSFSEAGTSLGTTSPRPWAARRCSTSGCSNN